MTREEWLDEMTGWYDLRSWCFENGVWEDEMNDIFPDDELDEYVDDDIRECDDGWRTLRDWLSDIPTGYDWYKRNGYFDYEGVDYDFDTWKNELFNYLCDEDWFDDEEDEEEEEEHDGRESAVNTDYIREFLDRQREEEERMTQLSVEGIFCLMEMAV